MPPAITEADEGFTGITITARDGLQLYVRDYGPRSAPALPVVCLPGLARSGADFHLLATALGNAPAHPRRVLALDYRGRGRSAYDPNAANYTPAVELADVLTVLTALRVDRAVFVGTSRGGILTMLLASVQPSLIAGAVLNDIGPVIEIAGLMRIKDYVGKLPQPASYEDGAAILRRVFNTQFPKLGDDDWINSAKRTWIQRHGRLVLDYDPQLARTLDSVDPEHPLPSLWDQFDALAHVPVMAIRGALSDILSAETLAAMCARHPDLDVLDVPDQGHVPLLAEAETIARIAGFIARVETAPPRQI